MTASCTSPVLDDRNIMIDARYITEGASGIGRYTEHFIEKLLELEPNVELTLVTSPERPEPFSSDRIDCRPFNAPPNSLRTRYGLSKTLDFDGIDLFHSPFNILPRDIPVPAVFTLHDIMWLLNKDLCTRSQWRKWVTGTFYETYIPRSVDQASRILTVSHNSRREIEAYFPSMQDRVDVAYNAVDSFFEPVKPSDGWPLLNKYLPPKSKFVLVVGQGSPYKNHAGALEGFLEAFGDNPHYYFVLVRRMTRGPEKHLKELMNHPKIASRIIQLDYVSGEELKALYSLAEIFLFPSLYEGFGLPALEAMASGTPVVTSNRGAPDEIGADAAVKVNPESPEDIGRGLRKLADNPQLREDYVERGFERAGDFTWNSCADDIRQTYRKTLEET